MQIRISATDGVPIYLQIVRQIKRQVASGHLEVGEELPPIRVLAEQLLINPNTVARAYLELEREGLVIKRQGSGTYVAEMRSPLARRERIKILADRAESLLAEARHLDIDLEDLVELLRQRHKNMNSAAQL
ncbi:MAG: GntR family transcriptional regulator [Verrucomicrobiota bacterium]